MQLAPTQGLFSSAQPHLYMRRLRLTGWVRAMVPRLSVGTAPSVKDCVRVLCCVARTMPAAICTKQYTLH